MHIDRNDTGYMAAALRRPTLHAAWWIAWVAAAAVGCANDGPKGGDEDRPIAPADVDETPTPNMSPADRPTTQDTPTTTDSPSTDPGKTPEVAVAALQLQRVSSCDDLESLLRDRALVEMNERIDALKKQPNMLRLPCAMAASAPSAATPATSPPPTAPAGNAADRAREGATSTSMTNNQVQGVDEADFVKNDSKYVYTVVNGALRIVEAWPAETARVVSSVKLEGTPKKLFVLEDRALVYVSLPRTAAATPNAEGSAGLVRHAATTECTYGYDCQFGGDGTATAVLVFDIQDRSAPKQIRRIDLTGSLLAARRIGSAVHTVVVTPELVFPGLSYAIPGLSSCGAPPPANLDEQLEALRAKNKEIIEKTPLANFVPSVTEDGVDYAGDTCDSVYRERVPAGAAFTSLVSLDLESTAAPVVTTILSKPGAVYASSGSLYMAVIRESAQDKLASVVHKFRIGTDPKAAAYLASGTVKGHVLNQFSMDEHEGHLRVATSFGRVPSPNVHSTMSVLATHEQELAVVGTVDNIAPGEDIRSVRFDADRGFIVTFKKTDPLYVFDLSSPKAPKITGELKIPGFSTYMHMLSDEHLLTIGYDAEDQGNFAFFTGVLLQIFDVSDPQDPKLAHKTVIGTRGSSSEALTNHLAFTLFGDKLALPMTICEGGGDQGQFGTMMTFSGLMLFDVSVANGFKERGRVAHPGQAGSYDNAGCSNWWTRASSVVQRSIFMDDFVYSIAQDVIRVQNIDALGKDVAAVKLTQ